MSKTGVILGSAAMALSLFVSYPALSQDIDFGDDSGHYANDGECDDPRFGGLLESHVLADATDCLAAYEGGHVEYIGLAISSGAAIDFGEDSGSFANDGECDDPRFGGELASLQYADATDCRAAYEADPSIYVGDDSGTDDIGNDGSAASDGAAYIGSIDFGDNSSDDAHDNVCGDPRFTGPGSASILLFTDRMTDANDCEALFAQGQISFNGVEGDPALAGVAEIDFGDDTSSYANNDTCDDPRFAGPGTDFILLHSDLGHDATDCRALFESGSIYLAGVGDTVDTGSGGQSTGNFRINFGDDLGDYPNDGKCDDARFQGRGAAMELFEDNILGDATDCRAAYDAGTVTYMP